MSTVRHVKLYFDTCDSHMSTTFKESFVTLNEDHNAGILNIIAYGLTILFTSAVKYVMIYDTGQTYTMMEEACWVLQLKH